MKTFFFVFLIFFSWWGFAISAFLYFKKVFPDNWIVGILLFVFAWVWALVVRSFAENWRDKNY
ncbi:MAG: hypothetical protein KGL19_06830 [Bacteroidota bacterium]|nr:hypothetical protein [Bacteroidota bacterium]